MVGKELLHLLFAAVSPIRWIEVTAPGCQLWGRLLLFHVNQGDNGTGQNPGLHQNFSNLVNRIPRYKHDAPPFWRGQKKQPLLFEKGETTATIRDFTALYLVCILSQMV